MIIDLILDRKDGVPYDPAQFYRDVSCYGKIGHGITRALDYGEDLDIRRELCAYIDREGYNAKIKRYVNSVEWL